MKTFIYTAFKEMGENGYQNPSLWDDRKSKQIYEIFYKPSLVRDLAAALFPLLGLTTLTQRATSGQGIARMISPALRDCRENLN